MRIEDYQKWLSSQFLDEPAEEEAEPAAAVLPEEQPVAVEPAVVEPVQFTPEPAPPAPAVPAWRPPSPPEEPPIPAEAVDTSQLGPAAYIGRAPATRPSTPQPEPAEPTPPPPPPAPQAAAPAPAPHIDTEPVYTQPARVIDESEEVAPPIDRYLRRRRPEQPAGQLPLEVAAAAPEPEPEPEAEPEPVAVEAQAPPEHEVEAEETVQADEAEAAPEPEAEVVAEVVEAEPALRPEPALVPEPEPVHAIVTEVERPAATAAPEPAVEAEAAAPEAAAPEEPEPKPEAPIRRARHARNVRPTEVVREMDAKTLWNLVPRHIQTLVALDSDEVTQNSYKRAFRESRVDLVQRLLDPTLSLEETSRLLNVCPTTVRRYTNRGLLTHQRTSGDQRRFKLSDVLAFLEAQQQAREP